MPLEDCWDFVRVTMVGDYDQYLIGPEWNALPIPRLIQRVSLDGQPNDGTQNGSCEGSGDATRRQDSTRPQDSHAGNREGHDRHPGDRSDRCADGDLPLDAIGHVGVCVLLEDITVGLAHRDAQVLIGQAHSP